MIPVVDKYNAIYVVTDAPSELEFGIDCITYETGPKFSGLSAIPAGFHFIYYSTGMGSRQGYFVKAVKEEVYIHSWDSKNEEILPYNNLSRDSLDSLYQALSRGELNASLGAYPLHQHHSWSNISNFIDAAVLEKSCCPVLKLIIPGDDSDLVQLENKLAQSRKNRADLNREQQALKPYFPNESRVAQFVDISRTEVDLLNTVQLDSNRARSITSMMLDKSQLMEKLISDEFSGSWHMLLGQYQLSFILFMLLYSFPALEYWKLMTSTICSSSNYLRTHEDFSSCFIKSFYEQLKFCPADFFENELSKDNFLRPVISALFLSLQGQFHSDPAPTTSNARSVSTLLEHKKRLFNFLKKKFNLFEGSIYERLDESMDGPGGVDMDRCGAAAAAAAEVVAQQLELDEELMYNLVEQDLPVFVSEEEVNRVLFGEDKFTIPDRGSVKKREVFPPGEGDAQSKLPKKEDASDEFKSRWARMDEALRESAAGFLPGGETDMLESVQLLCSIDGGSKPRREEDEQEEQQLSAGSATTMLPLPPVMRSLTQYEKEQALFCWRYPLVYDSMMSTNGKEDMTMAAVRILDDDSLLADDSKALRLEAVRFLEFEAAK